MRAITCLVVALMLLGCAGASQAAINSDTQQVLVQLETKYFGHSFDGEDYGTRTERLEKLIFGTSTAGDLSPRIEKLVTATGSDDGPPPSSTKTNQVTDSTPATQQPPTSKHHAAPNNIKTASAMPTFSSNSGSSGGEEYPHIATLENEILGQTYPSQPLTDRLKRMEIKAFGTESNNPDLSARTEILDWYAEKKLNKTPFAKEAEDEANAADDQAASQSSKQTLNQSTNQSNLSGDQSQLSKYPHITVLEQEILGQTYEGDPLNDRLSRMETKAFGKSSKSTDLSMRTDALEKYAQKKLHAKPFEPPQQNETASGGGQAQQSGGSRVPAQVLSMVANSLLGSLGGMGGFGGIGPGFGPGAFPPGMYGSNNIKPTTKTVQPKDKPSELEEDPEVFESNPPPATARTLTKVGWCEVQVFGQTFPKMHLEERLVQLNRELQVKPGATSVQLLDDIGLMIKAAQARKKATPKHNPIDP